MFAIVMGSHELSGCYRETFDFFSQLLVFSPVFIFHCLFFSFHVVPIAIMVLLVPVEFFLVVHRLDSLSLCYVSFVVRSAVLLLSLVSRVQTIVQACITGSKL
jgi:hypothetical protein